ncbi:hypothetical protein SERLA73DRAFT_181824 [Serpula lacrymans var. lacrymans S7.3]|uniref:Methylosome subunit pICln n=2 Tax=Serpula lacrymans var. lacrymans TaxID=341189 RepID=F8PYT0_SERL3|nr:uncharacterized protein SERLADRAFT_468195 [Serpula lacrymans var. lacrymans S7.9]EGN99043.1 hypothetical protein SERLA73DRAFT_181824 [Serpula lacrymans var. lacrymans S7.3]EGO24618.1 hypothetical protein SERLADRAFT_468195 [Serpula lacrymans var. lacrymans S7.9]
MPSATLIAALPAFVSPDAHRELVASTPASFSDIPPVLRHKEDNVAVSLAPPLDGFSEQDSTQGSLYVLESALVFMSSTGRGFQIEYPAITLHAISRAQSRPSIYCQLDEASPTAADVPPDQDDMFDMRELNIVPQNHAASLDNIFEAMSLCASLHPDPNMSDDEDMDDAFIATGDSAFDTFTGDEDQELSEVGRAALDHLESIIYNPFDRSQQSNGVNGNDVADEQHSDDPETKE